MKMRKPSGSTRFAFWTLAFRRAHEDAENVGGMTGTSETSTMGIVTVSPAKEGLMLLGESALGLSSGRWTTCSFCSPSTAPSPASECFLDTCFCSEKPMGSGLRGSIAVDGSMGLSR